MSKAEKDQIIRHLKAEATSPKSSLIALWSELVRVGAKREARGLEAIIGRLEDWQSR